MAFLGPMPEGSGEPELGLGNSGGNGSDANPAPGGFFAGFNRWLDKNATAFSPLPPVPVPSGQDVALNEEKNYAMLCHLLAFSGTLTAGVGNFVGPLVPWLLKRDSSPFVDAHGKESINFQISALIVGLVLSAVLWLAMVLTCGAGALLAFPAVFLAIVFWCYVVVRGSMMASEGKFMAYPFTFRLLK